MLRHVTIKMPLALSPHTKLQKPSHHNSSPPALLLDTISLIFVKPFPFSCPDFPRTPAWRHRKKKKKKIPWTQPKNQDKPYLILNSIAIEARTAPVSNTLHPPPSTLQNPKKHPPPSKPHQINHYHK